MSCSAEIFSFDQTSGDNNVYYENEARKKVNEMGKESHVVINSMKKLKLIKAKPIVEATSWHKRANSCPTYYYVVCLEDTDTFTQDEESAKKSFCKSARKLALAYPFANLSDEHNMIWAETRSNTGRCGFARVWLEKVRALNVTQMGLSILIGNSCPKWGESRKGLVIVKAKDNTKLVHRNQDIFYEVTKARNHVLISSAIMVSVIVNRNVLGKLGNELEGREKKYKQCSKCCSKIEKLKSCAKCKQVRYCGGNCQRSDWDEHKISCKPHDRVVCTINK